MDVKWLESQEAWEPLPDFVGAQGFVPLPEVRLWCWDTGGDGESVVLLHPFTGSGEVWGYQQQALAAAGYRGIAYSRRGCYLSEPGPPDDPGTVGGDLHALVNALDIERFHLVGSAAGGFAVFDYALRHPERLLSATVASSLPGIDEPEWVSTTAALLPDRWRELPHWFHELGPSYRAANPTGTRNWVTCAERSITTPVKQGGMGGITWAMVESVETSMLLMTGDADLYMPPSRLRQLAGHVRGGTTYVLREAGHAAFWEQPAAFNTALLEHCVANRGSHP
ncbi:MAG: alpha/beta fold hydrolase [Acidimicrobiales bacterium]